MERYTENLEDFGFREIKMLRDILDAWVKNGLPDTFENCKVKPAMNNGSGYVFLVNEEYQVAMLNGDTLEVFHSTPYGGLEGFLTNLVKENTPDDMHREDVQYVIEMLETESVSDEDIPQVWLKEMGKDDEEPEEEEKEEVQQA